jgi:hypothetical protein
MIIVKYKASGIKFVVKEDVDRKGFWEYYRSKKRRVEQEDPEGEFMFISSGFPRLEFEITNDRLADGCDQYVARPDDWPIHDGEPE